MMGHGEQGLTGLILAVAGAGAGAPTLPIPLDSYTESVGAITDHEDLFGADPAHAQARGGVAHGRPELEERTVRSKMTARSGTSFRCSRGGGRDCRRRVSAG